MEAREIWFQKISSTTKTMFLVYLKVLLWMAKITQLSSLDQEGAGKLWYSLFLINIYLFSLTFLSIMYYSYFPLF